jgi:hypothetical protein
MQHCVKEENIRIVPVAASSNATRAEGFRERTLGILAPADLDELLDIADFGRHFDGM